MREKLIELLGKVTCPGGESLGSCPDRKYGLCGEVANLSYCVIQNIADYLIANGVTVQQWIPVSERLPDFKTKVLVYGGATPVWVNGVKQPIPGIYTGYTRGYDEGWFTWDDFKVIYPVTHWMPLPEPPKEELSECSGNAI
jgi:hypothetical protein